MSDVTQLLSAIEPGNREKAEQLLPLVYERLRRLTVTKMAGQPAGYTLQATALVHEAWIRISGENHRWENRKHSFSAAAEAMRRILVDQARRKQRLKRGGRQEGVDLESIDIAMESTASKTRALSVSSTTTAALRITRRTRPTTARSLCRNC